MATEALKRLRQGMAAWNRRDWDATLEFFSEDIVWMAGGQIPDLDSRYEGHERMLRFFKDFVDPWEEISVRIDDVLSESEEQVFCVVSFHARGRAGIEVDGRFFQIYRFDDELKMNWFQAFPEDEGEAARREAGLA